MCVLFRVGRILLPAKENIKSDLDEAEKMNQNKNAVIPYLRHYSIGDTSLPGLEPGASCLGGKPSIQLRYKDWKKKFLTGG